MNAEQTQVICGTTSAMIDYIKSHRIGIDVQHLEELDLAVKNAKSAQHAEFLMESKRVRELLRAHFAQQDQA